MFLSCRLAMAQVCGCGMDGTGGGGGSYGQGDAKAAWVGEVPCTGVMKPTVATTTMVGACSRRYHHHGVVFLAKHNS